MKMTEVLDRLIAPGELAHRLGHEPGLQADVAVPHLSVDLRLRDEGRDRVDHDDIDRAAAHEDLDDLERLLAGVRLRDEQLLGVHADA